MPALRRPGGPPLRRQIAAHFVRAIDTGALRPGERLPSTRALASMLGVSRNTVIEAYEELAASGLVASQRGDGARVAARPQASTGAAAADGRRRAVRVADPDGTLIDITF